MNHKVSTPRFATCTSHDLQNGNIREYSWDKDKIHVEEYLSDDLLMLQNVFEGKIISPSIYPLIYDHKTQDKETSLRSLEFYKEVQQNHLLYRNLSKEDKIYFLIGLRDLFVASCRSILNEEEKALLREIVEMIDPNDEDIVSKRINNIDVTPYPTSKNKLVRFLDEKTETVLDECFIRNEHGLLVGFVDPRDLSYHNFENIVNLDSCFTKVDESNFRISNLEKHPNHDVYTFDMKDETGILMSLNKYGLYVPPLNKLSRGGERFIFASEKLGLYLTRCIKREITDETLMNDKFRFVNYVFRYNKFIPNDNKFKTHYDTPYHDPENHHYSKYTIIFYLTSGVADPVLSLDDGKVKFDKIETQGQIKGIIFDQKYEHEGKAFINGQKIFIRSELVYKYDENELKFDSQVSKRFNIACYMTKQSMFNEELEKYASECFDLAAKGRLNMVKEQITKDILVYKVYKNVPFITNGYDYWFSSQISLKDAGILTLLDYFNCKFETGKLFNKLTYSEVLNLELNSLDEIFKYLATKVIIQDNQDNMSEESLDYQEPTKKRKTDDALQYGEEVKKDEKMEEEKVNYQGVLVESLKCPEEKVQDIDSDNSENSEEENFCCDYHCEMYTFVARKCGSVIEYYKKVHEVDVAVIEKLKDNFSIFLLDREVKIEKNKILVTDTAILFNEPIPSINFAAHWNTGNSEKDFVIPKEKAITAYKNIPPIPYVTYIDGYHLRIELFNNTFVRTKETSFTHHIILDEFVPPKNYDY